MKKIKAAVIGYGNIGKYVVEALEASPDFHIAGIVRRDPQERVGEYKTVASVEELGDVGVAILCVPTLRVEEFALEMLAKGINTVDSFDIHSRITQLRRTLDGKAKESGAVAIISAGWDPGSDSVIRALLQACAPQGVTYTNFGPGMSMGHTVAAKAVEGVGSALSVTIPAGSGIHRRMVYVELMEGYDFEDVAARIKNDPYFVNDQTQVVKVTSVDALKDMGHGTEIVRKGVSGKTHNQMFRYDMRINNPALTAQVMICAARASMLQKPGAYTMIEIPPIDLLYGDREELIAGLV